MQEILSGIPDLKVKVLPTDVSHSGIKVNDNSQSITVETEVKIAAVTLITFTGILISVFSLYLLIPWIPYKVIQLLNKDRKPKRYKYTNEISEESLESYKEELYELVIGFIEKGILTTYKSQDRTIKPNERQETEAKERKVVFETIQTQRNMTNVLNEMKKTNFKMFNKMEHIEV